MLKSYDSESDLQGEWSSLTPFWSYQAIPDVVTYSIRPQKKSFCNTDLILYWDTTEEISVHLEAATLE